MNRWKNRLDGEEERERRMEKEEEKRVGGELMN